jgi:hypothetical protein
MGEVATLPWIINPNVLVFKYDGKGAQPAKVALPVLLKWPKFLT